jgi:ribosomal protein S18 acetylase RimI-like enzyme
MDRPFIETATEADLADLWRLENACFDEPRRASRRSLRRSLTSARQRVRVARLARGGPAAAAAILILYPRTLRIYSVAVAPELQGRGLGKALVHDALAVAAAAGAAQVGLEVDALDAALVAWYERQGFATTERLANYYGPGRPALRMKRRLAAIAGGGR